MKFALGIGVPHTPIKGGGANVWRFPDSNAPVRRAEGGYWLKAS